MGAAQSGLSEKSAHEFTVKQDSRGKDVDLSIYKGKVLLIVNVASKCGFSDTNYTQLTELYSKYKDKGFEVLAFPCNQFMRFHLVNLKMGSTCLPRTFLDKEYFKINAISYESLAHVCVHGYA